jgi:hypothetical protein
MEHLSEESVWASRMAARLRLIIASCAEDPAPTRRTYLVEEIERELKQVSPTRRKAYLDSLVERFPSWEGNRSTAVSQVKTGATPLTPEELVARLVELGPTLSPEARTAFAQQLHGAGLSLKESANAFLDLPPELMKKLGIAQGRQLQLERAVKMLIITAELGLTLDQVAWAIWKQIGTKSAIRKESDIAKLAGPYLAGDVEVSTTQLNQAVEKTRRLIAALLGAVARAGVAYAKAYSTNLAPDVIEDWAKLEKKWNESVETAAWKKFKQLAAEHASEPAIEHQIQEAIAKEAEILFARGIR